MAHWPQAGLVLAEIDVAAATTVGIVIVIATVAARLMALYVRVRVGGGYFCPKCNYNLQGIDTDHCPECGLSLADSGVAEGRASYSFWRFVFVVGVSAFFALSVLLPLAPLLRSIPWYQVHTTRSVISDLKLGAGKPLPAENAFYSAFGEQQIFGNFDLAYMAFEELQRRERNDSLPLSAIREIDEFSVLTWDPFLVDSARGEMRQRLLTRLIEGKLTPELADRFFSAAYRTSLDSHDFFHVGDDLVLWLSPSYVPSDVQPQVTLLSEQIDGQPAILFARKTLEFNPWQYNIANCPPVCAAAIGRHRVDIEILVEFKPARVRQVRHLSASFEVIARTNP